MYIYSYGAIGSAVRSKIENYKAMVRGGEKKSESFADVLKGELEQTSISKKVVSATGQNTFSESASKSVHNVNGSTILYALQNSETDTTASTVLSNLGYSDVASGGSGELKIAADSLSKTAADLVKLNGSGSDASVMTAEFVSDFNKLITLLNSESTSSAYLYKNALSTSLSTSKEELSAAGISYENGFMTFSGQTELAPIPDTVLNNVAISANAVSSYADTIISSDGEEFNGVSDYYNAIIRSYM